MLSLKPSTLTALFIAIAVSASATSLPAPGMAKLMKRDVYTQPCVAVSDHFVFKDGPQYMTLQKVSSLTNSWSFRGTSAAYNPDAAYLTLSAGSNASPKNIFVLRVHTTLEDGAEDYAYWLNKDQKCQIRVPRSTARAALDYESYEVKVQQFNG